MSQPSTSPQRGYQLTQVEGRGLLCGMAPSSEGKGPFTPERWEHLCIQAASCNLSVLHPKVADGATWWYSIEEIKMLWEVAASHNLQCFPVCTLYGNTHQSLMVEAGVVIAIGTICGGVCPQMGEAFEGEGGAEWALSLGRLIRAHFKGPVLPLLFANPEQHQAFPWLQTLMWSSGWMPFVTQEVWSSDQRVQDVLYRLYPQWIALEKFLPARGVLPPHLLPVLELGKQRPIEILTWMSQMRARGYIAFADEDSYPSYAQTIQAGSMPSWTPASSQEEKEEERSDQDQDQKGTPTTDEGAPPPLSPVPTQEPVFSTGMRQHLTPEDLLISWSIVDASLPFDSEEPITHLWTLLMEAGYGIGAPIGPVRLMRVRFMPVRVQPFEGGRIFARTTSDGPGMRVWVQPTTSPRLPGTPSS